MGGSRVLFGVAGEDRGALVTWGVTWGGTWRFIWGHMGGSRVLFGVAGEDREALGAVTWSAVTCLLATHVVTWCVQWSRGVCSGHLVAVGDRQPGDGHVDEDERLRERVL
eukprot:3482989-Prymnesium_polylepis.1